MLTGSSSTGQSGWYRVDLITGEQKTLSRFSGSAVPHLTDGYIIGEYISAYGDAAKGLSAGSLKKLELCDTDGQRIREITLPDIPKHEKNSSAETLSDWKKILPNDFEFNEIRILMNHYNFNHLYWTIMIM